MKSFLSLLSERREMRAFEKCQPGSGCRIEPRSSCTGVVCATVCATPHPHRQQMFVFGVLSNLTKFKKSTVSQVLTKKKLGVFCINLFQILSVSTQIRISMDHRPNRYSQLLDGMFGKLSLVTESC